MPKCSDVVGQKQKFCAYNNSHITCDWVLSVFREQSRDRDRDKEKKRDREEDEEEAYERRKLERKLREKEAAYQEVSDLSFCIQITLLDD